MKGDLDSILADCLDGLRSGELTVEVCLERYPEHRAELRSLLEVAARLSEASTVGPSPEFRRAARERLISRLPPRAPASVTLLDRIRSVWPRPVVPTLRSRPRLAWALVALLLALTGGGGVGLAYAADGSSPGSPLHGLDRAMESVQLALARSTEGRAQLAMAFAQERLTELKDLVAAGASDADIQQAIDEYGENTSQAAQELATVAAGDDEARAAALANLLEQAHAVHDQVLSEAKENAPEKAQPALGRALEASQTSRQRLQEIFSGGRRGGPPAENGGGPPDHARGGPPDNVPAASESSSDEQDPDETLSFEDRAAGLEDLVAQALSHIGDRDDKAVKAALLAYEKEVESLAKDLEAAARDDAAAAAALAALLEETLSIQSEMLAQVFDQVPEKAADAMERAMASTEAALAVIRQLFANGLPGGAPSGATPPAPPGGSS